MNWKNKLDISILWRKYKLLCSDGQRSASYINTVATSDSTSESSSHSFNWFTDLYLFIFYMSFFFSTPELAPGTWELLLQLYFILFSRDSCIVLFLGIHVSGLNELLFYQIHIWFTFSLIQQI